MLNYLENNCLSVCTIDKLRTANGCIEDLSHDEERKTVFEDLEEIDSA